MYGTECLMVKGQQKNKLDVAEMRTCIGWVNILDKLGLGIIALELG